MLAQVTRLKHGKKGERRKAVNQTNNIAAVEPSHAQTHTSRKSEQDIHLQCTLVHRNTHKNSEDKEKLSVNWAVRRAVLGKLKCTGESPQNNHNEGWVGMAGWVQPSSRKQIKKSEGEVQTSVESKTWWNLSEELTEKDAKHQTGFFWLTSACWNHRWRHYELVSFSVNWAVYWAAWHLNLWSRAVLVIFSTVRLKKRGGGIFFPAAFLTGLALAEQINHQRATFLQEFLLPPGGKYLITHFLSSTDTQRPGQGRD